MMSRSFLLLLPCADVCLFIYVIRRNPIQLLVSGMLLQHKLIVPGCISNLHFPRGWTVCVAWVSRVTNTKPLCSPSQSCATRWDLRKEVVECHWTGRSMRSLLPTGTSELPSCLAAHLVASKSLTNREGFWVCDTSENECLAHARL